MLLSEPIVKPCASIDFNPDRIRLSHGLAEDMHTLLARISCQWLEGPNFNLIEYSPLLTDATMVFKVRILDQSAPLSTLEIGWSCLRT